MNGRSSRPLVRRDAVAAGPLALWLGLFLIAPLALVLVYAFLTRGPYGEIVWTATTANVVRLADPLYATIVLRSLGLAFLTTLACMLIGFPMAYTLATATARVRIPLFLLLMVPFLTNFVVRVYAIRVLLGVNGPVNALLSTFGLISTPVVMTDTAFAVTVGMITNYLPFMVLPIYVVLEQLDFTLLEAARDLGASGRQVLWRILLPSASAGLVSGCVLVFVPVLGEFMIPDLLGGARTMLLGNLVTEQFLKARDWPFGAALATLLVVVAVLSHALERRVVSRPGKGGALGFR